MLINALDTSHNSKRDIDHNITKIQKKMLSNHFKWLDKRLEKESSANALIMKHTTRQGEAMNIQ
jgi:hypothetical protein